MQTTRSQVASIEVQANAAITSHTASDQYESRGVVPDDATTLDMHGGSNEEEPEDEIPEEAVMDDRRPDIFLSDLPHSDVLPTEYLWRQCAVFMEVKKCLPGTVPSAMAPQQWPLSNGPSIHGCSKTRVWSSLVRRSTRVSSPRWRAILEF